MLTLKSGKTITIKVLNNDGTSDSLDISTKIASLAPQLMTPNWIDAVANTTAPIVSGFSNVQFRSLAKAEPSVVYKDGDYVTNPRDLTANQIKINICQITPTRIAEKLEMDEIDLQQESLLDVVAKYLSTWLLQVNKIIEIKAINDLCFAAQEFQKKIENENRKFTTFEKGAHFEKLIGPLTSDIAYKSLSDLKRVITRVGLPNANSRIDSNFKFASGINISDVIVLCSYEFLDTICSRNGVFSSDSGIKVFQEMGIRKLLGFDVLPISELPDGIHFLAFTTGHMGALGKGDVANGFRSNVQIDANWSWHERVDIERTFYQGVVYEQLVFMFGNNNVIISPMNFQNAKAESVTFRNGKTYYDENFGEEAKIEIMSHDIKPGVENSLKQKLVDKLK